MWWGCVFPCLSEEEKGRGTVYHALLCQDRRTVPLSSPSPCLRRTVPFLSFLVFSFKDFPCFRIKAASRQTTATFILVPKIYKRNLIHFNTVIFSIYKKSQICYIGVVNNKVLRRKTTWSKIYIRVPFEQPIIPTLKPMIRKLRQVDNIKRWRVFVCRKAQDSLVNIANTDVFLKNLFLKEN